jgi:hypothetical protein
VRVTARLLAFHGVHVVAEEDDVTSALPECPQLGAVVQSRTKTSQTVRMTASTTAQSDNGRFTIELTGALLKPAGRLLFLEANYWNPQVLAKSLLDRERPEASVDDPPEHRG